MIKVTDLSGSHCGNSLGVISAYGLTGGCQPFADGQNTLDAKANGELWRQTTRQLGRNFVAHNNEEPMQLQRAILR